MQNDAKSLFDKASSLYEEGRYAEALKVLDDLDRDYPDTRQIMFPRARCLMHIGRMDEASEICDLLIVDHAYKPAAQLKKKIASLRRQAVTDDWTLEPPPAPGSGAPADQDFLAIEVPGAPESGVGNVMDVGVGAGLDLDPDALANLEISDSFQAPAPSPEEESEEGSHKWGAIAVVAGGVALVLLVLVGLPMLISKMGKGADDVPPPPPPPIVAQETAADQESVPGEEAPAEAAPAEAAPAELEPTEAEPAEDTSGQVVVTLINNTGADGLSIRLNGPTRYTGELARSEQVDVPLEPGYYSTTFSAQGVTGPFWSGDIEGPETWTFAMEMGPTGQQCTRTVYGAQLADAGDAASEESSEWSEGDEWLEGDEFWDDESFDGGSSLFGLAWWLQVILGFVVNVVWYTITLMITLKLLGKFKHDDFGQNIQDVLATAVFASLLLFVPCIGIFLAIRLVMANYDFGFMDLLVWFGISIALGILILAVVVGIVFLVVGGAVAVTSSAMAPLIAVSMAAMVS